MRSSSIKTTVATLSIVAALVLAAPASAANRNEPRQNRGTRGDIIVRAINLIKRLGNITTFGLPTVPNGTPVTTSNPTGSGTSTGAQ